MTLKIFSFGGGVQSMGNLALQAQGELPDGGFDTWLFANVGDDSEHPGTLRYFEEHAMPFAERHGIDLRMIERIGRDGQVKTLYEQLTRPSRTIDIPVRMAGSAAPGNRSCTADFKIKVVGKWLKEHGATAENPATVGVGISLDEIHRVNSRRVEPYERPVYPLLDLKLRRTDCYRIIRSAGLPIPPKSACWFCPLHGPEDWRDMRRDEPGLFQRACDLEATLGARRRDLGKDPVYLTRYGASHGKSLGQVIPDGVDLLPLADSEGAGCDNGWCWT